MLFILGGEIIFRGVIAYLLFFSLSHLLINMDEYHYVLWMNHCLAVATKGATQKLTIVPKATILHF